MRVMLVYRDPLFSPNSVEKDAAIISRVGELLTEYGAEIVKVKETELTANSDADVFLSMGRFPKTLEILKEKECGGALVVNPPLGVERCNRRLVDMLIRDNNIPVAPLYSDDNTSETRGYWLKRADASAQSHDDIKFVESGENVRTALQQFKKNGINDVLVTEHVVGDIVKFYGVEGTDFFKVFYPSDDGQTKFDDESRNGKAHHYIYNVERLQADADRLAKIVGVSVYGGDCIVREDGSYAIIDFNDWPSFSRCREEAARAIVLKINNKIMKGKK